MSYVSTGALSSACRSKQASKREKTSLKYTIAIEPGDGTAAWNVHVPDLPDRLSAGDTQDDALENARGTIILHVQAILKDGDSSPRGEAPAHRQANPEYADDIWMVVDVPIERFGRKNKHRRAPPDPDAYRRVHKRTASAGVRSSSKRR